jgi:uncharacterized membrane protein required for colicin V production
MILTFIIALALGYAGYKMAEHRDIDKFGGFLAGFILGLVGLLIIIIYDWYKSKKELEVIKEEK